MKDDRNAWTPFSKGKWTPREWVSQYLGNRADCSRIDPYFVWADLTGFAFLDFDSKSRDYVRVILELKLGTTIADFCQAATGWDWITIPSIYCRSTAGLERARFCTAMVGACAVDHLSELGAFVERFALGLPIATDTAQHAGTIDDAPSSVPASETSAPDGVTSAPKVVVGIIDEGLPVAHARFRGWRRNAAQSRVRYLWNQDAATGDRCCLGYGSEIRKSQIDAAIRDSTHAGLIDEDEVYRHLGLRSCRRYATHGAHVMDLACGEEPDKVTDETPDIICVELPHRAIADTSGASLAVHVLDALRYILYRADSLRASADADPPQVVVNLSYGNFAGPHDGSSLLECAIGELIELRSSKAQMAVVLPAGNGYLSRCHGRHALPAGAEAKFDWQILPDDATPSFLELWHSEKDAAIEVEVESPWGNKSDWITEGQVQSWTIGDDPLCTVIHLGHVASGDRKMVLVCVAPTCAHGNRPTASVAPSGIWTIRVKNGGKVPLVVDAWIQRDDAVYGYRRRGRQSRFVDAEYERFDHAGRPVDSDNDSYIKRDGTLNGIATGERTVVVGGYRGSDRSVADYSAGGDDEKTVRGPDALAVSERSAARPGILAAGTRSGGSKFALSGTSVAAPQVSGWIAKQMARGEYFGPYSVRAKASQDDPATSLKDPPGVPGTRPPAKRGGNGRLEITR